MENKKLLRSVKDKVFAGVAGGLAEYLNVDPVLIRVLFVLAAFFGGGGVLAYIILWIIVPEAQYDYFKSSPISEEPKVNPETNNDTLKNAINKNKHNSGLIAGLVLITIGLIFLLERFIPNINISHLWPIILVVIGVGIIIRTFSNKKLKN